MYDFVGTKNKNKKHQCAAKNRNIYDGGKFRNSQKTDMITSNYNLNKHIDDYKTIIEINKVPDDASLVGMSP